MLANVRLRPDLRRAANGEVDPAGPLPRRKEGEYAAGRRTPPSAVKAKTAGRKTESSPDMGSVKEFSQKGLQGLA